MPHLNNACPDGEHERTWRGNAPVCENCGLTTQTIGDALGHDQFRIQ